MTINYKWTAIPLLSFFGMFWEGVCSVSLFPPYSPVHVLYFVHVGLSPERSARQAFPAKSHSMELRRRYSLCIISHAVLPSLFLSVSFHGKNHRGIHSQTAEREAIINCRWKRIELNHFLLIVALDVWLRSNLSQQEIVQKKLSFIAFSLVGVYQFQWKVQIFSAKNRRRSLLCKESILRYLVNSSDEFWDVSALQTLVYNAWQLTWEEEQPGKLLKWLWKAQSLPSLPYTGRAHAHTPCVFVVRQLASSVAHPVFLIKYCRNL